MSNLPEATARVTISVEFDSTGDADAALIADYIGDHLRAFEHRTLSVWVDDIDIATEDDASGVTCGECGAEIDRDDEGDWVHVLRDDDARRIGHTLEHTL